MEQPSSPFVKIRFLDRENVLRALERYSCALGAERPEIRRIILFGSYVSGTPLPSSDIDLLMVLSSSGDKFLDRVTRYAPDEFPVGVDVFAYTEEELAIMLEEGNQFARRAVETGRVVFSRD